LNAYFQKSIEETKPNLSEHSAEDSRYLVEYYLNEMKHNATNTMSGEYFTLFCDEAAQDLGRRFDPRPGRIMKEPFINFAKVIISSIVSLEGGSSAL
jgi:hypothetical protein